MFHVEHRSSRRLRELGLNQLCGCGSGSSPGKVQVTRVFHVEHIPTPRLPDSPTPRLSAFLTGGITTQIPWAMDGGGSSKQLKCKDRADKQRSEIDERTPSPVISVEQAKTVRELRDYARR